MAAASHRVVPPRLLSRAEAAGYIGLGVTTFDKLVSEGTMPKPVRLCLRNLWDIRELDAAIDGLPRDGVPPDTVADDPNEWDMA